MCALVPLLFEASSPDEAIRVARRIVTHTGVGVDTVAIAAIAHLEDGLHHIHPPVEASAEASR
uniref:ANTAR domain-containing protein n=1 Tax=Salinispora arenicola (strain CNS-205) TaxID=391037 RepID=A8LZM4_SALAI